MVSIDPLTRRIRFTKLAWKLLVCCCFSVPSAIADDVVYSPVIQQPNTYRMRTFEKRRQTTPRGYQGFGLNYRLGYGYGGKALGVGPYGGYPHYGGTGYPGPMPELQRFHKELPVQYYGNPGGPSPACPYYYGIPGGMVDQPPILTFEQDPYLPEYHGAYGIFTGAIPYPESTFTPSAIPLTSAPPPSPTEADETERSTGAGNPTPEKVEGK